MNRFHEVEGDRGVLGAVDFFGGRGPIRSS